MAMRSDTITAVGIDVSKGKSVVAIRRPGGKVVKPPFLVNHFQKYAGENVSGAFVMEFYFLKNISFRGLTFIGRFAKHVPVQSEDNQGGYTYKFTYTPE